MNYRSACANIILYSSHSVVLTRTRSLPTYPTSQSPAPPLHRTTGVSTRPSNTDRLPSSHLPLELSTPEPHSCVHAHLDLVALFYACTNPFDTSQVLLATDAFNAYKKATGATLDNNTGLLRITSSQFSALKNLNFDIGGETYALTPNAQIWPRSLNADIGGSSNDIYLVVADVRLSSRMLLIHI